MLESPNRLKLNKPMSKHLETNPHYLNFHVLRQCWCLVATGGVEDGGSHKREENDKVRK